MIVSLLASFIMVVLLGLVFLLPTYIPPKGADLSAFQVIAWLVPINEIVSLVSLVIVPLVIASLGYFVVNWTINKGRGSG